MATTVKIQRKTPSVQASIDRIRKQISSRAQKLAAERGFEAGQEMDDWLVAESQIVWKPELRLVEAKDRLIASFSMPGVQLEGLVVSVDTHSIVVIGETPSVPPTEDAILLGDEFRYGQIYRNVRLPMPVDPDKARAHLSYGVLTVTLPKPKPKAASKGVKTVGPARKPKTRKVE